MICKDCEYYDELPTSANIGMCLLVRYAAGDPFVTSLDSCAAALKKEQGRESNDRTSTDRS